MFANQHGVEGEIVRLKDSLSLVTHYSVHPQHITMRQKNTHKQETWNKMWLTLFKYVFILQQVYCVLNEHRHLEWLNKRCVNNEEFKKRVLKWSSTAGFAINSRTLHQPSLENDPLVALKCGQLNKLLFAPPRASTATSCVCVYICLLGHKWWKTPQTRIEYKYHYVHLHSACLGRDGEAMLLERRLSDRISFILQLVEVQQWGRQHPLVAVQP